jgi:hypothetical protein
MSALSPASLIVDSSGNAVGIVLDGVIYRLQVAAKLDAGDNTVGRVKLTDGTNVIGTPSQPVRTDPTGTTTQPVSDGGGSLTVDGPLTDTQLRATAVPVSTASLPLPTGASTSALQTSGNSSLSSIDGKLNSLGQKTMAASAPVVLSSDQSAIPVTDNGSSLTVDGTVTSNQGGTWNVNDISGTISLPTGAATESTLSGVLTTTAFQARINTLGQKTMANSTPVVMSSDQSAVPVTTTGGEEATYTVIAPSAVVGNNKSMLSIYNPTGSGYSLKLREFYIRNSQTTAVTGVAGKFELHRFASGTAPTGGTALTVVSHDSNDAIPVSMDARTGGTISGEIATPLDIMWISTDEWGPGTLDVEASQQSIANYLPARAKRDGLLKPFYARAGQGLHMKFAINSTAGSCDIVFVFTKV